MTNLIVGTLVVLAAVGHVSVATAQTSAPPPPVPTNLQRLPWWFARNTNMPGMPWFHRPPAPPVQATR